MIAVVDAVCQFRFVSVGAQGKASDAGILAQSDFKRALNQSLLNILSAKLQQGSTTEAPFLFLGGDAFPLQCDLMKPLPFRQIDHDQWVFNYRVSRAS